MPFVTYKEKLKSASRKLIEAQRPIRILNSIRVPSEWETELVKSRFKDIPKNAREYYESVPLGFDPQDKLLELRSLKDEIARALGEDDDLGRHLRKICDQYVLVVEMLRQRGRPSFIVFHASFTAVPRTASPRI
ncbi:MAG: DUF1704 domain-containing protein [Calothrix sp. SM1_5_4]|nr:DUF1704 domain-containing protein [Calothrix sp. SM1_5_4]